MGKPILRITGVPYGPKIPRRIREKWVGVEINVDVRSVGPVDFLSTKALVSPFKDSRGGTFYLVRDSDARAALKQKNEKAWRWFEKYVPKGSVFGFNTEACQEGYSKD